MKIAFHWCGTHRYRIKAFVLHWIMAGSIYSIVECFMGLSQATALIWIRHCRFNPSEVNHLLFLSSRAYWPIPDRFPNYRQIILPITFDCTPLPKILTQISSLPIPSRNTGKYDMKYLNMKSAAERQPYLQLALYRVIGFGRIRFHFFKAVDYGKWHAIDDFARSDVYRCRSILQASAAVNLKVKKMAKKPTLLLVAMLAVTAMWFLRSPAVFPQADYIILESILW